MSAWLSASSSPSENEPPVPTNTELEAETVPRRLLTVPRPDRLPLPVLLTVKLTGPVCPINDVRIG